MKKIKKVLLCGLGAVGAVYADKLQKFDAENFRVLVDENRLKRYSENPIYFNDTKLDVKYITPDDTNFKADLIIISWESFGSKFNQPLVLQYFFKHGTARQSN